MGKKTILIAIFAVTLISCSRQGSELKIIQQQKSGDFKITILNETGSIQQGKKPFTLEFRRATDDQLVDVGTVTVAPIMEMPGMSPMMATAEVTATETAGRYTVASNFTMAGLWKCQVKFGDSQSARFNLNAQ